MLVEKKNRLAKAQKPAWPSLFSAQQEKDEMDAFLDDIKDVEDKADVAVPQPFWKQDSWKHVGPLTWFRQEDLIEHERDESGMMKWENAESMNINDMIFRGQLYDKMTWMVIIVMI